MNLLLVPERPYYLCFLPCYYTCFARLDNHQAPHREVKSKCVYTHIHTHIHGYCLYVPLLVELPGRVLSKLEYESRNGVRRALKPPELLGQCLQWCVRAHGAHKLSFGFFFFFFLCCLKPDDMHSGATWLSELVVEYKVSFVQQGEETL